MTGRLSGLRRGGGQAGSGKGPSRDWTPSYLRETAKRRWGPTRRAAHRLGPVLVRSGPRGVPLRTGAGGTRPPRSTAASLRRTPASSTCPAAAPCRALGRARHCPTTRRAVSSSTASWPTRRGTRCRGTTCGCSRGGRCPTAGTGTRLLSVRVCLNASGPSHVPRASLPCAGGLGEAPAAREPTPTSSPVSRSGRRGSSRPGTPAAVDEEDEEALLSRRQIKLMSSQHQSPERGRSRRKGRAVSRGKGRAAAKKAE